jgi:cytochrome b pre-mRNA-processing protein 3
MIVAQARSPFFYRDFGIPDTVNGRFDMIVLHAALFLNRIEGEAGGIKLLGQGVFDAFCRDMDDNLREMGVGDLAVPKEMRRMGEAFYGRTAAYRAALAAQDGKALEDALARNVFEGQSGTGAGLLAAYVRDAARRLRAQESTAIAAGHLDWPRADPISAQKAV